MRTVIPCLLLLLLLAACKGKDAGVYSKEKMQAVLWDMMRADQFLSDYVLNKDSSLKPVIEREKMYQQVFAIHHTSKEEFQRSFSYYEAKPQIMRAIMDSIYKKPATAQPYTPPVISKPADTTRPVKDTAIVRDTIVYKPGDTLPRPKRIKKLLPQ